MIKEDEIPEPIIYLISELDEPIESELPSNLNIIDNIYKTFKDLSEQYKKDY